MHQSKRKKGIAKVFLSSKILPWMLCDFLISFALFHVFSSYGRGTNSLSVQIDNNIASLTLSLLFCLAGVGLGFFERENRNRRLEIVKLGAASWLLAMTLGIALLHFAFFMKVGRYALVYGSLASILGILTFHIVMSIWLHQYPHQFIFLGPPSKTSDEILKILRLKSDKHLEHNDALALALNDKNKHLGDGTLETLIARNAPMDIVLTSDTEADKHVGHVATVALQNGLRVVDEGQFYVEVFRRFPVESLSTHWIVRAGFDIQKPLTNTMKRCCDILFSAMALIVLSPFLVLIALAIKLSSPGPVFYVQVRQGRYSKNFRMIKFRSMVTGHKGSAATDRGDVRVTAIGKLLRPLHLDELPQLINILRGQMSFVGPRPEAIEIVNKTNAELPIFEIRHMVRPGLTGWAQISQGKTKDGLDEVRTKLSYDLYYAKNYGLVFDALIVLRTVFVLTKSAW